MKSKFFILCLGCLLLLEMLPLDAAGQQMRQDEPLKIGQNFRAGMTGNRKLLLGFDSRRSFINRRQVNILGVRIGVDYGERVRMGFGVYGLTSDFTQEFAVPNDSGGVDRLRYRLGFGFVTTFIEYVLFRSKRWEVSVPWYLGLGRAAFIDFNDDQQNGLILSGLGTTAQYKIFPFIGLYVGLGYRQVLYSNAVIEENLSNLYYTFGVKVFLGAIYRKIFNKESRDTDF